MAGILGLCCFIAYVLPYHVYPFRAFYNDWIAIFGIVIALAYFSRMTIPSIVIPFIVLIPFVLALTIALQASFGMLTFQADALLPIAYCVVGVFGIILGATISNTEQGATSLPKAIAYANLLAGLLSVIFATLQFMSAEHLAGSLVMLLPDEQHLPRRPYGNLGQPNQFALLLCFAIAALWYLYQLGSLKARWALIASLIFLWGVALTQSRIGWIILPAFALIILYWGRKQHLKKTSIFILAGLMGAYIAFSWMIFFFARFEDVRVQAILQHSGQDPVRMELWRQALQISLDFPWFGAGWLEFGSKQLQLGADFSHSIYSHHSHNIILNLAAEVGWPITLVCLGLGGYWIYNIFQRNPAKLQSRFALLVLVAVGVHSLVEFPLWYGYVLVPVTLLLGMTHQVQIGSQVKVVWRVVPLMLFFCMGVGMAFSATEYRQIVLGFRVLGWSTFGLPAEEGSIDKPKFSLFPQYYDYFAFTQNKAREGMSVEEIERMEHVAKRFGYPPVLMRMSLIYAFNGQPHAAIRTMATMRQLHYEHYADAYGSWRALAATNPAKYGEIFQRMPRP